MTQRVTIYGAGVFGLCVAFVCARRGARVQVIDPNGPGGGASGGIVGALAPHTPENWNDKKAFQFESLRSAESFWGDVAKHAGTDPGYARTGRLQAIADDRALELALARSEQARTLWQGFAEWHVERHHPDTAWQPASPSGWIIRDTLSARIHPARACATLARAVQSLGGSVIAQGAPAKGDKVVEATGYRGLEAISAEIGRTVGNGVKGQAVLLGHDMRDAPQLFIDGLHIIPHADGTTAIGSTSEREYRSPDETDMGADDLLARARDLCPPLATAPEIRRWAGVRPRARSRAPMLGHHPTRPGAFIANGGFKIGFGMAPRVGEVMADLILGGSMSGIPEAFLPEASL